MIIQSLTFILIIFIGYFLKRRGFFKKEDATLLAKIVMNITLPAAIIANFQRIDITLTTIFIIVCGIGSNLLLVFMAKWFTKKESPAKRALYMINCSGYNVGNFTIPFVTGIFPAQYVTYICLFDMGNALMALGGIYSLAKQEANGEGKIKIKDFLSVLLKSIPFMTYVFIFLLSFFHLDLPRTIIDMFSKIGSSNAFLAMLLIGVSLEINLSKNEFKELSQILILRYGVNLIVCLIIFFLVPIELQMKQALLLVLCAPITTIATIYSKEIDEDSPIPALANSVSIMIGIVLMMLLMAFF